MHRRLLSPLSRHVGAAPLGAAGITTDGSALYPEPIREVFDGAPHQVCEFHVLKVLLKAVLRAVAKVRKELAAKKAHVGRGRPGSKQARRAAGRNRRHRMMQKTVYRVRTHAPIKARIAIDMLRDAQAPRRTQTTQALHYARDG